MIFRSIRQCRHAAGSSALVALSIPIFHFPHILEPTFFCISALLTVYEPMLVREEVNIVDVPKENDDAEG